MKKCILFLQIFLLFSGFNIAGGGEYNSISSTRAFSLNGLYFAGKPGIGSIQTNPAGLVFLQNNSIEFSIADNVMQNEFESSSRGAHKSYRNDNFTIGGGLSWNLNDDITVALGYYPLTDYLVDWPFVVLRATDSSSSILAFSMMNRLEINSISPAVAFSFGDLSIGLTANIYQVIQQISFPRQNDLWEQGIGLAAYQFSYNLDGWAFGGTLGLLYNLSEDFNLGVTVRSGFKAEIKGDAESIMFAELDSSVSSVNASTEIEIPWKFGAGFLFSLNENTDINIDFSYQLWGSTQKNLDYKFDNSIWQSRTGDSDSLSGIRTNSINLSFENSFEAGIGIEYRSLSNIIYRAGYRFSQSPNTASTYNFLFPGIDNNVISIGIGYKDESLTIDAGFAYTFGITKEVSELENNYTSGSYNYNGYIPSLTLKYEF